MTWTPDDRAVEAAARAIYEAPPKWTVAGPGESTYLDAARDVLAAIADRVVAVEEYERLLTDSLLGDSTIRAERDARADRLHEDWIEVAGKLAGTQIRLEASEARADRLAEALRDVMRAGDGEREPTLTEKEMLAAARAALDADKEKR